MPAEDQVIRGTITDYRQRGGGTPRYAKRDKQGEDSQKSSLSLKIVLTVAAIVCVGILVSGRSRSSVVASSIAAADTNGVAPADAREIPDIRNWSVAKSLDLNPSYTHWLQEFGVNPASKVELDSRGSGVPSGSAYLLVTGKSPQLKRVVWVNNGEMVYDATDKIQGMVRVPASSMSRIAWHEGSVPPESPEGDGLMVIRDYTQPNGVTVFFLKSRKLYAGEPADLSNIELR